MSKALFIKLIDPQTIDTEASAMLQALYSRSTTSVAEHVEGHDEIKLRAAASKYYLNYGHKSIGDCASTTLYIENVSMFVAKAIQDFFAYKGQESSTRYINFDDMGYVIPESIYAIDNEEGEDLTDIPERLLKLYNRVKDVVYQDLVKNAERPEGVKDSVWENSLRARSFDIARGWLPCGAKTNVSWHGDLRQISDRLDELKHHPLEEVREVALEVKAQLVKAYPSTFSDKVYEATDEYYKANAEAIHYGQLSILGKTGAFPLTMNESDLATIDDTTNIPEELAIIAATRPKYAKLPRAFELVGTMTFMFTLDFASFRDVQRHRSAFIPNVLVMPEMGFHRWYLDQLPEFCRGDIEAETNNILLEVDEAIRHFGLQHVDAQYLCPMGTKVPVSITANLCSLVYILELRSSITVHPTLRSIINLMAQRLRLTHSDIKVELDESPDALSVKRGTQSLEVKGESEKRKTHTHMSFELGGETPTMSVKEVRTPTELPNDLGARAVDPDADNTMVQL